MSGSRDLELQGPTKSSFTAEKDLPILEPAPEPRPTCAGCGKPRVPAYRRVAKEGHQPYGPHDIGRAFSGWKGYGHFCTQRCAVDYANWVVTNKGIRLVVRE